MNTERKMKRKSKFNLYSYHLGKNEDQDASGDVIGDILKKFEDPRITDIHFEPGEEVKIRIRYCGKLIDSYELPIDEYKVIVNRLLVLCGLDVVMNHYNADGSFEYAKVSYRVSFIESLRGVSCVIRRLRDISQIFVDLPEGLLDNISGLIGSRTKVIIFSGPTGSGKSTTMSYITGKLKDRYKVHTIENPVEFKIPGTIQIQISKEEDPMEKFKYILRQDPEIIVVGELRSSAFAKLLFDSSVSGNSVFTSLHCSNVFEIVSRLRSLGVSDSNISSCVDIMLNQRLIPRVCPLCDGIGCTECYGTGYSGYLNLFEVLHASEEFKSDVTLGMNDMELKNKYKNTLNYLNPDIKLQYYFDHKLIDKKTYDELKCSF
jgi:type IV pilus assembly protein PilB